MVSFLWQVIIHIIQAFIILLLIALIGSLLGAVWRVLTGSNK